MNKIVVIGRNFKDDPDCVKHLPIADDGANLYEKCKDGILLWSVVIFSNLKLTARLDLLTCEVRILRMCALCINIFTSSYNLTSCVVYYYCYRYNHYHRQRHHNQSAAVAVYLYI